MAKEFRLDEVVPWGRSAEEYRAFFALSDLPPALRVLDCAAGPSSFAAEMAQDGADVTAVDPLYRFAATEIRGRIDVARQRMAEGLERAEARFRWDFFGSPEGLIRYRMATMQRFLDDYETGRRAGRYRTGSLPELVFADRSFDLVLCSHFLFMYDHELDLAFHRAAILEMLRIAPEVRIFPVLNLDGTRSRFLAPLVADLDRAGIAAALERVAYEFQRGGNEMLRIVHRAR